MHNWYLVSNLKKISCSLPLEIAPLANLAHFVRLSIFGIIMTRRERKRKKKGIQDVAGLEYTMDHRNSLYLPPLFTSDPCLFLYINQKCLK